MHVMILMVWKKRDRIAPELSAFGRKMTSELEYGDSHIPHTWEAWARTKLKKPDSFRTERVLDKMPNFGLKHLMKLMHWLSC